MKPIIFEGIIHQSGGINAAFIEFPYDVYEVFGVKGQVKVKVVFDNKIDYRGSLANMGKGCHTLGITKEIRKKLNKNFGDKVSVTLEKDLDERVIIIPSDVEALLMRNPKTKEYFDTLSYTNRKEYIVWIESAKKTETRKNRLQQFMDKLNSKKRLADK